MDGSTLPTYYLVHVKYPARFLTGFSYQLINQIDVQNENQSEIKVELNSNWK